MAYMAKIELFEKFVSRLFMDFLGAFAVNREKLDVSTIKTAMGLKKTNWKLSLFPEGTRTEKLELENVSKGFAFFAKSLKCDILPVGISGALKKDRNCIELNRAIELLSDEEIKALFDEQKVLS